jgi:hypothetical protein
MSWEWVKQAASVTLAASALVTLSAAKGLQLVLRRAELQVLRPDKAGTRNDSSLRCHPESGLPFIGTKGPQSLFF